MSGEVVVVVVRPCPLVRNDIEMFFKHDAIGACGKPRTLINIIVPRSKYRLHFDSACPNLLSFVKSLVINKCLHTNVVRTKQFLSILELYACAKKK